MIFVLVPNNPANTSSGKANKVRTSAIPSKSAKVNAAVGEDVPKSAWNTVLTVERGGSRGMKQTMAIPECSWGGSRGKVIYPNKITHCQPQHS